MKIYIDRFVLTIERTKDKANLNLSSWERLELEAESLEQAKTSFISGIVNKGQGKIKHHELDDFVVFSLGGVIQISRIYLFDLLSNSCQDCGSTNLYTRFPKPYCQKHAVVDLDLMQRILDVVYS